MKSDGSLFAELWAKCCASNMHVCVCTPVDVYFQHQVSSTVGGPHSWLPFYATSTTSTGSCLQLTRLHYEWREIEVCVEDRLPRDAFRTIIRLEWKKKRGH